MLTSYSSYNHLQHYAHTPCGNWASGGHALFLEYVFAPAYFIVASAVRTQCG